jgi:hypothetical protein
MGIKRKRSFDGYSPASSTTSSISLVSDPTSPSSSWSDGAMEIDPVNSIASPMQLWAGLSLTFGGDSGRTRKRWRDNRPVENDVHSKTSRCYVEKYVLIRDRNYYRKAVRCAEDETTRRTCSV